MKDFRGIIKTLVLKSGLPGRHAARNALKSLERANKLVEIDPEIAVFLSITALEESSTAIISSVKRKGYKYSDRLDPRDHIQKIAIIPFIQSLSSAFAIMNQFEPQVVIDTKKPDPKLEIRLKINKEGKLQYAYPIPPLNFQLSENGKPYFFEREFEKLSELKKVKEMIDYVRTLANLRNKILYASADGIPKISSSTVDFIKKKENQVSTSLIIFLLIDQNPRQIFVQQGLISFLKMIKKIPKDLITE